MTDPVIRIALVDVLDEANADDCENLGQASIAAVLRREGYAVELFSLSVREISDGAAEAVRAIAVSDIVGFSIYFNTADATQALADRVKSIKPGVWTCAGGQLATSAAEEILADCPAIDACLLGEAEATMLAVARAHLDRQRVDEIPAVVTRSTGRAGKRIARGSVDGEIWPVRDLYALSRRRGNPTARLNSSRGCVANCEFCSVNGFANLTRATGRSDAGPATGRWRGRDPDDVYAEISELAESGIRSFVFNDASFEDAGHAGRSRVRRLCTLIAQGPVPLAFRCSMRAENVAKHGDDLLPAMRQAGFTNIFIGVESGSDDDLRAFAKLATVTQNQAALAKAAVHGIDVTIGFIMFQPFSTVASLKANFRMLHECRADKVSHFTSVADVYFGTPLHHRLHREGKLTSDFTYKNPLGYYFSVAEVGQLSATLAPLRHHPSAKKIDGQLYHLGYTLSALRALFADAAAPAQESFFRIRDLLAAELADFFEPVFFDMRAPPAARSNALLTSLSAASSDLSRLGARLMVGSSFAPFFGRTRAPLLVGSRG